MGCPAAGNAAFVAHYDRVMGSNRTYRITNNADVVPSMLPTSIGCAPWQGGSRWPSIPSARPTASERELTRYPPCCPTRLRAGQP